MAPILLLFFFPAKVSFQSFQLESPNILLCSTFLFRSDCSNFSSYAATKPQIQGNQNWSHGKPSLPHCQNNIPHSQFWLSYYSAQKSYVAHYFLLNKVSYFQRTPQVIPKDLLFALTPTFSLHTFKNFAF